MERVTAVPPKDGANVQTGASVQSAAAVMVAVAARVTALKVHRLKAVPKCVLMDGTASAVSAPSKVAGQNVSHARNAQLASLALTTVRKTATKCEATTPANPSRATKAVANATVHAVIGRSVPSALNAVIAFHAMP